MGRYVYSAVGPGGRTVRGRIEGASEAVVVQRLRSLGYFPTCVKALRSGAGESLYLGELPGFRTAYRLLSGGGVRPRTLAVHTRQMAVLSRAGIPLARALAISREQSRSANLRRALADVLSDIEAGSTLYQAMERQPRVFPPLYAQMVKAGETSGALDTIFFRLADLQKKRLMLRSKIRGAMMYPAVVFALAAIVVGIVMVFVVPQFEVIYASFNQPLPDATLALIAVSNWVRSHVGLLVGTILGIWILFRFVRRTGRGGMAADRVKLGLPLVGGLYWKAAVARMARTLCTLLDAGVPILEALETVAGTTGNRAVGRGALRVRLALRQGESVADAFRAETVFPSMLVHMLSVGEEAGALDTMLSEIADVYDQEVEDLVGGLTDILEPLALVVLGITIGAIVIALYYPIFSLIRLF